jgi:hypothetical protein
MCGLVGIADAMGIYVKEQKALEELLYVDTLRGPHSTGIFCVADSDVTTLKKNVSGDVFIDLKCFDNAMSTKGLKIVAGHNRWATVGKVTSANAHPFTHGTVTMMHNGTLKSQKLLDRGNTFGTDSECIAYNLSKVSPEDAGKVVSNLQGAFALVWYDERDGSLNFIRNSERTLFIANKKQLNKKSNQDINMIVWASEDWMIDMASSRQNINLGLPEMLKPMRHYKFIQEGNKIPLVQIKDYKEAPLYTPPPALYNSYYGGTNQKKYPGLPQNASQKGNVNILPRVNDVFYAKPKGWTKAVNNAVFGTIKYEVVRGKEVICNAEVTGRTIAEFDKVKNLVTVPLQVTGTRWDSVLNKTVVLCRDLDHRKDYKDWFDTKIPTLTDTIEVEDADLDVDDIPFDISYLRGPYDSQITEDEFLKKVGDGCSHCGVDLSVDDSEDIVWYGESPLCPDCTEIYFGDVSTGKAG